MRKSLALIFCLSAACRSRLSLVISPLNRKRMTALVLVAWITTNTAAQTSYPSTTVPESVPWGGVAMPESVPYQPTLIDPGCGDPASSAPFPTTTAPVAAEPWVPLGEVPYPDQLAPAARKPWFPPGSRDGVFQKVNLVGAYLPQLGDDGLGLTEAEIEAVFGLPFLTRHTPLLIRPFYGIHFVDGPSGLDVPPRLHDAAVQFEHFRPLSDDWLLMGDITIGEFADDHSFGTSEALRITGGGAAVYRPNDVWKVVLGAQYIDRANANLLPVAGFVYTPNDDWEYKLVFPVPRISWRLPWTDMPGRDERWAYIGAEYGGGAWGVQRASGASDGLDITEYQIFLGYERKIIGGLSRHIELGWVFGRELRYRSRVGDTDLGDTLMLRGGLSY